MFCPSCGNTLGDDAKFCQFCGADVTAFQTEEPVLEPPPPEVKTCPQCGFTPENDALFCDNCGARLDAPAAPVSPPVPAAQVSPEMLDNAARPARKKSKALFILIPLVLLAAAAAFLFLWNGGEYWDKLSAALGFGDEPSVTAGDTTDAPDDPTLAPSDEAPTEQPSVPSPTPPEEIYLQNDGSLESALRLAAAEYLNGGTAPTIETWQNLSVHVTYQSESYCDFAVTAEQDGKRRLLAQLAADLSGGDGSYTASNVDWHWETVALTYDEGLIYNENDSVTNADPSAITLIPNGTDHFMEFSRNDEASFTLNGVMVTAGVHDTQENYDAYAQPTLLDCTVSFADGSTESFTIPLDICEFQGYPSAYILPEPIENAWEITLTITQANGEQGYIAIGEISFF